MVVQKIFPKKLTNIYEDVNKRNFDKMEKFIDESDELAVNEKYHKTLIGWIQKNIINNRISKLNLGANGHRH